MALQYNTSADHLAPSTGGFEPQRAFNFLFGLSIPAGAFGAAGAGTVDETALRDLSLAVESVDFPRYGTQVIPFRWLNEVRKVAGGATVQQMQVTIRDFVDLNTYGLINGWMEAVHSSVNGSIGMASRYKGEGNLILLTPEGVDRSIDGDGIRCIGVWPSEFSATRVDYEQDTALVKINLVLQVDKIIGLGIQAADRLSQVSSATEAPGLLT